MSMLTICVCELSVYVDIEGDAEREMEKRMVDDETVEDEAFFKKIRQQYKNMADAPDGKFVSFFLREIGFFDFQGDKW